MVFDLSAEDSPIEAIVALQTPLQIAAKRNNIALVELLLEHGASALKCPVTAHAHVERVACGKMSGYLFNGEIHVPIYKEGGCIYTCLQYAAVNENLDMIRLLIAQGADPDSRVAPRVGDTPLQISARLGNVAIFHLLLESGASLDAPPGMCDGRTALQGAAESGNLEILLILQRLGGLATLIQAPASNELGMTALQAACLNGHRIFAALLLAFGAHVNEPPSPVAGLTAVQAAAWGGNTDLIRDLITLGACVDLPATGKGTTALLACMRHKSLPLLELIAQNDRNANLSRDWRFQTPLQRAVYCDWFAGVEVFLASGAKVNDLVMPARNREFKTLPGKKEFRPDTQSPLGRAITNGSETITDLLLQHEADVLTPVELEYDGRIPQSALRHAIGQDSDIEIINLLLAKVPELERHSGWEDAIKLTLPHDNGYVTRLMIEKVSAMPPPLRLKGIQPAWDSLPEEAYGDLSLDECVRLLVEGGASVNSQAEDGSTILQRISEDGWLDTWRFLIQHGATINVDATRSFGTPLQEAFKWEKADAANLLLENGADINALPALERGVTALQAAAINGMLEMATRLLESGADVAAPAAPVEGRTAIDGSAERGNWDMVQLLLNAYEARGLDPGPVCAQAAEYAGREGYDQLAKWLREYSPS
jgi:ankyrin repeat protein